jgi:hypothetical protein
MNAHQPITSKDAAMRMELEKRSVEVAATLGPQAGQSHVGVMV